MARSAACHDRTVRPRPPGDSDARSPVPLRGSDSEAESAAGSSEYPGNHDSDHAECRSLRVTSPARRYTGTTDSGGTHGRPAAARARALSRGRYYVTGTDRVGRFTVTSV